MHDPILCVSLFNSRALHGNLHSTSIMRRRIGSDAGRRCLAASISCDAGRGRREQRGARRVGVRRYPPPRSRAARIRRLPVQRQLHPCAPAPSHRAACDSGSSRSSNTKATLPSRIHLHRRTCLSCFLPFLPFLPAAPGAWEAPPISEFPHPLWNDTGATLAQLHALRGARGAVPLPPPAEPGKSPLVFLGTQARSEWLRSTHAARVLSCQRLSLATVRSLPHFFDPA